MHIAYIISQYPAISHTFVQREILALRDRSFTITTISIRKPNPAELLTPADQSEAAQTHTLLLPNPFTLFLATLFPLLTSPFRFLRTLKTAWHLRRPGLKGALWSLAYFAEALLVHRILKKQKISHLHAHFANNACDVALLAVKFAPRTFSFTMHGPTEFADVAHYRLAEKSRAAKFIICISDFARSQLMPLLPPDHWPKLHVVHCGLDPAQFPLVPRPSGSAQDPSSNLQTPNSNAPIENRKSKIENILTIARLTPVKAHPILFQAFAELLLRGHNLTLTLAGDGPSRKSLEQLADRLDLRPHIHFLGNVSQAQVPELLAAADIFVLPSFAEGVPVVLMEAMAARRPVIATHIAGIPELIEDNHTGLLIPPGRPDLLATAIERLLSAPHFAHRLATAAHQKIQHDFNLHQTSHHLANIFHQYLKPAQPHASAPPKADGLQSVGVNAPSREAAK